MDKLNFKIPYGKNVYDKKEINAVTKVLKNSTQMGKCVSEFEKKVSKLFGKKYGVMVNSGSSAILIALDILNIKKNSEIIIPCLNFGTAISSLIIKNYKPIFIDINKETLQIDENKIEKKINKNTAALMIPNLIGNVPKWSRIFKIAKKYNLKIIEDSADTVAPKINNLNTSKFSDVTICSFYGSHVISCGGNGGIIMMNNKKLYNNAKILRSWGRSSSTLKNQENIKRRLDIQLDGIQYDRKFVFSGLGYNFEPSEILAAFGLEQLKKFNKFKKVRYNNFLLHQKFFKSFPKIFLPIKVYPDVETQFLAYPIILRENLSFSRKNLQVYLEKNNIQTRPIFTGNSLRHPAFQFLKNKKNNNKKFLNSDYIMKYGLLIGCHQGLTKQMVKFIHSKIKQFVSR